MKKERPILFSTPMVKAILEGRKTQTRRVVKPQPPNECTDEEPCIDFDYSFKGTNDNAALYASWEMPYDPLKGSESHAVFCPFGKPGDILWVRETIAKVENGYLYKANGCAPIPPNKWKPSIHMPKDAARIWLQITHVRVERLQDISYDDAIAEGVDIIKKENNRTFFRRYKGCEHFPNGTTDSPQYSFQTLWQYINGKKSFDSNPWVWVVEFERIEKP